MRALQQTAGVFSLLLPMLVLAGVDPDDQFNEGPQPATKARTVEASNRYQATSPQQATQPRAMQIYASDKTAQVLYERTGPVFNLNNSRANAGFLFNEERDNVLSAAIMYDAEPEFFPGLTLSFGSTLYAGLLGVENNDIVGLAAGLQAAYTLPIRQFPLQLRAAVNYAPDILSFGQADRIIDWNVRSGLALTNNIDGFVGLRFLQFDTRPGDRELDKQVHLGIRWNLDN